MATSDKVIITKSKINSIVDAIHSKNGESQGYTLDEMPDAIRNIGGDSGDGYIHIYGIYETVPEITIITPKTITITSVTPVN